MNFDSFYGTIVENMNNRILIPNIFPKLRNVFNISRSRYYVIGGDPGTGKSAWLTYTFVIGLYEQWMKIKDTKKINIHINFFSMERNFNYTVAKILAYYLMKEYKILISFTDILSEELEIVLNDDILEKIKSTKEFFKEFEKVVHIYHGPCTPNKFTEIVTNTAKKYGYHMKGIYCLNNDDILIMNVVDHMGLFVKTKELPDDKQVIDYVSRIMRKFRDDYKQSFAVAVQFNRNINQSVGNKASIKNFLPTKQDFKGSGNIFEDADVVVAIVNPKNFGLNEIDNYIINDYTSTNTIIPVHRFRISYILKNSFGPEHLRFAQLFIGEVAAFKQIGRAEEMNSEKAELLANLKNITNVSSNSRSREIGAG